MADTPHFSPCFVGPSSTPADSVLCHCRRVTEAAVHAAIAEGLGTVEEISLRTTAGTACRGCHCRMKRILAGLPASAICCQICGCSILLCGCAAA